MITIPERSAGHLRGGLTTPSGFGENVMDWSAVSDIFPSSSSVSGISDGSDSVSRFAPQAGQEATYSMITEKGKQVKGSREPQFGQIQVRARIFLRTKAIRASEKIGQISNGSKKKSSWSWRKQNAKSRSSAPPAINKIRPAILPERVNALC